LRGQISWASPNDNITTQFLRLVRNEVGIGTVRGTWKRKKKAKDERMEREK